MATTKPKKPAAKKKPAKSAKSDAAAIAKKMRTKADNEGCVFC